MGSEGDRSPGGGDGQGRIRQSLEDLNLALDPASEQVIQRELVRGHFTTPAEVVASALRLLNSHEDWLQENREAISERLELSFEQSRNGETYTPE